MSAETIVAGVVRERRDDDARTVTTYDAGGKQTGARPYTSAENDAADLDAAARTEQQNRTTIEEQAAAALAANTAYVASSPTTTQVAAQVKALTRQVNKLIRLQLNRLDGTD